MLAERVFDAGGFVSPFPSSPRVVYAQNPLIEVLCQLRFPTILQISADEPAKFQNDLRPEYPLYELINPLGLPSNLPPQVAQILGQFGQNTPSVHTFSMAEREFSVSLASDFIAVAAAEAQYRSWEQFTTELRRAKQSLEAHYSPAFYTRIGLRYKDVIDREKLHLEGADWAELIGAAHIGILGSVEVGADIEAITTDVLLPIPSIPGGKFHLIHGLVRGQANAYLIDADFYTEERSALANAEGILDEFNQLAGNFFRWFVTGGLASALGDAGNPPGNND